MPNDPPLPLLLWLILPVGCAVSAAIAAVMHYGAAVRGNATDIPNLPMAIGGGAVAGFLSAVFALSWVSIAGGRLHYSYFLGILFAGLGGEYFGGRCGDVLSATRAGAISAVVLLPVGILLMNALR